MMVAFPVRDSTELWRTTPTQVATWQADFPHLDVVAHLQKMRAWAEANPMKRKTRAGMARFVVNWLLREDERRLEQVRQRGEPAPAGDRSVCARCGGTPRCRSFDECTKKILTKGRQP